MIIHSLLASVELLAMSSNISSESLDSHPIADKKPNMALDAQELLKLPASDAIPELSLSLYKIANSKNREPRESTVYTTTLEALISIPGHAIFYEKRIKEASDAYFSEVDPSKRGNLRHALDTEKLVGFQRLELMTSSEAVAILGDFLFDDRGYVPNPKGISTPDGPLGMSPNSSYALKALAALPLETKPLKPRKSNFVIYEQDIGAWRLWFEQIKAGTRTFRFKGSAQNYSLSGPVDEALIPSPRNPPVRNSGRTDQRPQPEAPQTSRSQLGLLWCAAGCLLVLILWFIWRKANIGLQG